MGITQSISNIAYHVAGETINSIYNRIKGPPTNAELIERRKFLQEKDEELVFAGTTNSQAIEYIDQELRSRKLKLEKRRDELVKIIGDFGFSESDIDNSPDNVGKVINSLTIGEYIHVVNQLNSTKAALSGNYQG